MYKNKKAETELMTNWIIDLVILAFLIVTFIAVNIKIKDNTAHNLRVASIDYSFVRAASQIYVSGRELNYNFNYNNNITLEIENPCIVNAKLKNSLIPKLNQYPCIISDARISEQFLDSEIKIKS